jgi:hypothetical protein
MTPTGARAELIARYRCAAKRYAELVPRRGTEFIAFDRAATEMFEVTAAVGEWNRAHKDALIEPHDCGKVAA